MQYNIKRKGSIFSLFLLILLIIDGTVLANGIEEFVLEEQNIKVFLPTGWQLKDKLGDLEILSATDAHNNALFSLYAYNLPNLTLTDFKVFMEDHFQKTGWYLVEEIEGFSFDGQEAYRYLQAFFLEDERVLFAEHAIFQLGTEFFLGRFVSLDALWEGLSPDREIIFANLSQISKEDG